MATRLMSAASPAPVSVETIEWYAAIVVNAALVRRP